MTDRPGTDRAPTGRRPGADRAPTGRRPGADRERLTVGEAAARLGLSTDAVRSRLHRSTLEGLKDAEGWAVYLPTVDRPSPTVDRRGPDGAPTVGPTVDPAAYVGHLEAELAYLREQLDHSRRELAAERERFDVIHREALERIPAQGAGEASSPATPVAPARPWWRRWLGGVGRG